MHNTQPPNHTSPLSREDRYILEKHSQDLFRMLLKGLITMETNDSITPEDRHRLEGMLAEYFTTRTMLTAD